jgi:hypothetical protein
MRGTKPLTMRRIQNPLWVAALTSLVGAEYEAKASEDRQGAANKRLAAVVASLRANHEPQFEVERLERASQVADDDFASANKALPERRLMDDVEAHKQETARVLEGTVVPAEHRENIRILIAVAGMFLGVLGGMMVALRSHCFRRSYLSGFAIERDFGVAVPGEIGHSKLPLRKLFRSEMLA